jgi:hypothetical protein
MKDFLTPEERRKLNQIVLKKTAIKLIERARFLKNKMINEFEDHPITKEIQAGESAYNSSETLSGRQGNLFSFIGFEAGSEPLEPIYEILNEISITQTQNGIRIIFPSAEDIWQVTPMPWQQGRSWAKGIESGISGLNYYLFSSREGRFSNSRSGTAIQANKVTSNLRYIPRTYISNLLNKYKKLFQKLSPTVLLEI